MLQRTRAGVRTIGRGREREELEVVATELARLRAEVASLRGELASDSRRHRGCHANPASSPTPG